MGSDKDQSRLGTSRKSGIYFIEYHIIGWQEGNITYRGMFTTSHLFDNVGMYGIEMFVDSPIYLVFELNFSSRQYAYGTGTKSVTVNATFAKCVSVTAAMHKEWCECCLHVLFSSFIHHLR